jgi:hypothetical protein
MAKQEMKTAKFAGKKEQISVQQLRKSDEQNRLQK